MTDKQALRKELSNPAIGSKDHLRKLALALLDELEASAKQNALDIQIKARLCRESNSLHDRLREAEKRIADYHRALNNLAAVARRYLPDYDEHPDIQAADDLLESAAGIGKGA